MKLLFLCVNPINVSCFPFVPTNTSEWEFISIVIAIDVFYFILMISPRTPSILLLHLTSTWDNNNNFSDTKTKTIDNLNAIISIGNVPLFCTITSLTMNVVVSVVFHSICWIIASAMPERPLDTWQIVIVFRIENYDCQNTLEITTYSLVAELFSRTRDNVKNKQLISIHFITYFQFEWNEF